jgi:MFS family permease
MGFPRWLRALDSRDFRLFFAGQNLSLIGTWMQSVGQSWLVLQITSSAFKLGVVGALQFAPMLFLSFVAGAVADRVSKRGLVLATQTTLFLQALILAGLVQTGAVRYWHIAVLALVMGLANTFDMPTRQSFVAEMVGREALLNGIALNSASFNAARVVGPALAGLLIARYGLAIAFFLNAISFVPVIGALLMVRTRGLPHPREDRRIVEEIFAGVRYAIRSPRLSLVLSLLGCVSVFVFNFNVLVPLLAREVLHVDAHGFGELMAAVGVGAVTAALGLAALGRARPSVELLVIAALVAGGGVMTLGFVDRFALAVVLLYVTGGAGVLFMASCNTTMQVGVPDVLRGRMMSLYTFVFAGVVPIGSAFTGSVAQTLGVATAFRANGALAILSVMLVALRWRRQRARRAAEGQRTAESRSDGRPM